MRFMLYHHRHSADLDGVPTPEQMTGVNQLVADMTAAGVLIATEGLRPSAEAKKIVFEDGKIAITDGPFTEAKELIAGFALVDVASMEEAVMWSKRFVTLMGEGTEGVIAPLYETMHVDANSPGGSFRLKKAERHR